MCTVITHPSTSSEVLSRLRVQADVVVAGRGVVVALAWAAVVRLYLISSSEGLVIEERRAAIALLERVRDQSTSTYIIYIHIYQQYPDATSKFNSKIPTVKNNSFSICTRQSKISSFIISDFQQLNYFIRTLSSTKHHIIERERRRGKRRKISFLSLYWPSIWFLWTVITNYGEHGRHQMKWLKMYYKRQRSPQWLLKLWQRLAVSGCCLGSRSGPWARRELQIQQAGCKKSQTQTAALQPSMPIRGLTVKLQGFRFLYITECSFRANIGATVLAY